MSLEKLILGTAQFGLDYGINNENGKVPASEVFKILDSALEAGVTQIDTANAYGDVQTLLSRYPQIDEKFKIFSKFTLNPKDGSIDEQLEKTLLQLKICSLAGYSFHCFDDLQKVEDPEVLQKIKEQKMVDKFGVSIYTNQEFASAISYDFIDIIQIPFNLLDCDSLKMELIQKAKEMGKTVHARSTFLQGLLFKEIESFPEKLHPLENPIAMIDQIARENRMSISELAISFVSNTEGIDGVLIGVDSLQQFNENMESICEIIDTSIYDLVKSIDVLDRDLLLPINWS